MVTPVTLYSWFGKQVEKLLKIGALQIIKAFCLNFDYLSDKFYQQVSYVDSKKYNESIKLKVEF